MKQPVPSDNKRHTPDPCSGPIIVPSLRPPKPELLNSSGNRNINQCFSHEKGWSSPQCLSRQLCPRKVRCNPPWIAWREGYGGSAAAVSAKRERGAAAASVVDKSPPQALTSNPLPPHVDLSLLYPPLASNDANPPVLSNLSSSYPTYPPLLLLPCLSGGCADQKKLTKTKKRYSRLSGG
jgi:hypothetical protein